MDSIVIHSQAQGGPLSLDKSTYEVNQQVLLLRGEFDSWVVFVPVQKKSGCWQGQAGDIAVPDSSTEVLLILVIAFLFTVHH